MLVDLPEKIEEISHCELSSEQQQLYNEVLMKSRQKLLNRIGQTRGVQVFKLVTKGTFEERIDALISQKGELMEDIITVDDHHRVKNFTREEIVQLLQFVSK
jgi:SNF2 family DNA or RNA helicase